MKIGVDNNNSDSLAARKQFTKMLVNKERHLQYYCKCLSEKSQEKQKRRRGMPFVKSKCTKKQKYFLGGQNEGDFFPEKLLGAQITEHFPRVIVEPRLDPLGFLV